MVRALILCGSANREGVTRSMCQIAYEHLADCGYDVTMKVVSDLRIDHCRDCGFCERGSCTIGDDMQQIYDAFSDSDLLILASPIHFSGPSSLIKTVMDRFQPYWFDKSKGHPRYCAGMLCGGSSRPNFEITEKIFRAFSLTTGMRYLDTLTVSDTDSGVSDLDEEVATFVERIIGCTE